MSAPLQQLAHAARRRVALSTAAVGAGLAVAVAAVAARVWGLPVASCVMLLFIAACVAHAWVRMRRHDAGWAAATLDAARPDLDDSSALLLAESSRLGPLQRLQRERVAQRLHAMPAASLLPSWPRRAIIIAWLLAALAIVVAVVWPHPDGAPVSSPSGPTQPRAATAPVLQSQRLDITPPTYTGQPATQLASLDASAPAASRLAWTLRFSPQPDSVELQPLGGAPLVMHRQGEDWRADSTLAASMLYRVLLDGVPLRARPHRIDAVRDQPPRVSVREPERSLVLVERLPQAWPLVFEAEDDHGVSAEATLVVVRSEGTGENIRFHETRLPLRGRGEPRRRQFEAQLVPSAYGLQHGEDLVVRLEVTDNRAPRPQSARSASVILRWPEPQLPGADGLDALARQILPAYFRSQRQIIIDAEALLKERPRLQDEVFASRSDSLGVDQRLLRLRYGQFLGEESEGGGPPPTSDLPTSDLPTNDLPTSDVPDDHAASDGHAHGHDDDAGALADAGTGGFGEARDILGEFGHTHDIPEAATLLDPQTRETLRKALREMWQSELHLRQAAPQDALPYAHRALAFIKEVQQAERIYLQRVGTQLPPIDESRRLGGKRDGIERRALAPAPSRDGDPLRAAWRALEEGAMPAATLDALQAWAAESGDGRIDPLSLIAAVEDWRADPGCDGCRDELRALLWAAMSRPDAGIGPRSTGGTTGRRYLEALDSAAGPMP